MSTTTRIRTNEWTLRCPATGFVVRLRFTLGTSTLEALVAPHWQEDFEALARYEGWDQTTQQQERQQWLQQVEETEAWCLFVSGQYRNPIAAFEALSKAGVPEGDILIDCYDW